MDASTLVEIMAETPFQPLVLRLSDGRSHVVRHPEQAIISNRVVYVVTPREGDPRIAENVAHVSIEQIVEVAPALPSS
ncbi:MAG: hypothetical protein ACRCT8_13200 [Lacipirellulaceae bacterium]